MVGSLPSFRFCVCFPGSVSRSLPSFYFRVRFPRSASAFASPIRYRVRFPRSIPASASFVPFPRLLSSFDCAFTLLVSLSRSLVRSHFVLAPVSSSLSSQSQIDVFRFVGSLSGKQRECPSTSQQPSECLSAPQRRTPTSTNSNSNMNPDIIVVSATTNKARQTNSCNLTTSTANTSSAPVPTASPQRCTGQPVHQVISSASPCALGTPRRHRHKAPAQTTSSNSSSHYSDDSSSNCNSSDSGVVS